MPFAEEYRPYLEIEWRDKVAGKTGYLVIDSLGTSGLCTGGTRMRAGCTLEEVQDLAKGMALKTGVYGLPVGGAKGGIDCDPKDPEAKGVLSRFMTAVRPFLDTHWVTAEDLGVPQHLIDEVFVELGLGQSYHAAISRSNDPIATLARVRAGLNAPAEGGLLGDVVGGYGVAQSCLAVARAKGWNIEDTTVAIQGVGTMGGGAAWYLHKAGMKVIEVADAAGALWAQDGERLDIPGLLESRNQHGEIDRSKVDSSVRRPDRNAIVSAKVDILVPAATSYAIREDNVHEVQAKVIVEAANAATTPESEHTLNAKGICVIPDFVANAGAVAWAWWLLQGFVDDNPETTFDMLRREIGSKVEPLVETWEIQGTMPRFSAMELANKSARNSTVRTVTIP